MCKLWKKIVNSIHSQGPNSINFAVKFQSQLTFHLNLITDTNLNNGKEKANNLGLDDNKDRN